MCGRPWCVLVDRSLRLVKFLVWGDGYLQKSQDFGIVTTNMQSHNVVDATCFRLSLLHLWREEECYNTIIMLSSYSSLSEFKPVRSFWHPFTLCFVILWRPLSVLLLWVSHLLCWILSSSFVDHTWCWWFYVDLCRELALRCSHSSSSCTLHTLEM